ncbi:aminotransferase class V-fold PLP-dependent enzyme [Enterococcus hulanensis]|uniref:aminotransferase class V-fold PLP-dependent enzyme n=1 Tax=Enterococcus hulanensis TaxID=2559929 RepID=UPI00288FAD96|nr:aminotransferase class V-fold PLP-dependent enzyme [Enterococcus hulanensis]MDT2660401.1 aminotransferase class V-fold PLP-dependent enzyme [Enterococcus hulanensis]
MKTTYGKLFNEEELEELRAKFFYVNEDFRGTKRIFFDNAGGSFRLIAAEQAFYDVDAIPDCSEHSNELSHYLENVELKGLEDIKQVIFNAEKGVIYPSYTASQIMMEMVRILSENTSGTNNVTTLLEHPSAFDSMTYYSDKYDRELRIAGVNKETGGVDADQVISLIDEDTAILCCMAASNISGYIYDIEKIFTKAREINPDIFIICDAVQHAPHGILDPEKYGIDVMNIAPYKFFGIRGFSVAYLSDRVASFDHHRLLGKEKNDWSIGSPAAAHYASITAIVDYVVELGSKASEKYRSRRDLYEIGMTRIEEHERALLEIMLEGSENAKGLRHCEGLKVQMDGKDLNTRDFILGVEFDNIDCEKAIEELEKRGVIAYERSSTSMYSKRMVSAFDSKGVVRISPLHVNSVAEVEEFLRVAQEVAKL